MIMKYILLLFFLVSCNTFVDPATGDRVWIKDVEEDTTDTIEGIDSDKDGVRDDVQKWIDLNIKDYNLNMGMKQYVKYKTQGMLMASDKTASRKAQNAALDALSCQKAIGYSRRDVYDLSNDIDVILFNTKKRLKTNGLSEYQMSGSERIGGSDKFYLERCEFKIQLRKKQ